MEYILEHRYVCKEHGFDKSALAKGPRPKQLKEASEQMKREHLRQLDKEFGCTDPEFSYTIKEMTHAEA